MFSFAARIAKAILIVCSTSVLAFGQTPTAAQETKTPLKPGSIRILSRNPLPGNWDCKERTCTCRPLACSAPAVVSYMTKPSPARKPDPKALERLATVDIPKIALAQAQAQAGTDSADRKQVDLLTSKVSKHLGYPSILSEAKITKGASSHLLVTAHIFAGPVLLTVQAVSPDRAVAMKSLEEYLRVIQIEEGPSITPNAAPTPVNRSTPTKPGRRDENLG